MADWKGSDTFFLVAGVVQAILALGAFLFLVAWLFAVRAYLGVGPGATMLVKPIFPARSASEDAFNREESR
jgi:hypothetical protein